MNPRSTNLLGALALAISDAIGAATAKASSRTLSDAAALAAILASPDEPIDTLAKTLGLSQAGASRLVDRLAAAGLVKRGRSDRDKRYRGLVVTPTGEAEARAVLDARQAAIERGLGALSAEQRDDLLRLVEPMLEALTPDRRTAEHSCRLCDVGACPQDRCPIEQAALRSER